MAGIPDFIQIGLYVILAVFLSGITLYTIQRRNDPKALIFSFGLLFQIIWILAFIFEILAPTTEIKLFFDTIIIFSSYFVGTSYFLFALEYNGFSFKKHYKFFYFVLIYSALLVLPVLIFPNQEWMRTNIRSNGVFSIIRYGNGIYLNILIIEVYLKIFFTFFLFIRNLFLKSKSSLVKIQSIIIDSSYLLLFFASIVSIWSEQLGIVERFISFYLLGLILASIFIFIAVFPLRTFEVLPSAHNLILDNIGDGYCVFNVKSQLVEINEELMNILGILNKSSVSGKTPVELFSHLPDLKKLANTPQNVATELNIALWDKIHYFEAQKVLIFQRKRKLGFVLIFHDISERKEFEQNLKASKEELEQKFLHSQKMDTIGQMAGGIAHDFNNILTVILGNAELLEHNLQDNYENQILVRELSNAAKNASRMTKKLLTFSRKNIIHPKVFNINTFLQKMKDPIYRLVSKDTDVEIIVKLDPTIEHIFVDMGLMEQILLNLVLNSKDAMPNGGILEISTNPFKITHEIKHLFPETNQRDFVCITVKDTGIGMTDEVKEHLFEPFFTTKPKGSGTGLGLSMVYGAVKQFQGFINVVSSLGKGTSVQIYIPIFGGKLPKVHTAENTILKGKGELIVLVEDDTAVRNITQKMLNQLGYRVLSFGSGMEAFDALKDAKHSFALLFTDIVMPGMKGHELFEKLKEMYPDLKVLYVSGYTDKIIAQYGVLFKDTNFISKPFSIDILAEKIYDIIQEK
ncbi:MAG: response regulator [Candidatus Lokiarchaeota archaeon]|nr:response regulator [Candidatus Lokiarchaeota archaeon]